MFDDMFAGAGPDLKIALRTYLRVIKPWCVGKDERGWLAKDFTPEVVAARSEFSQTIFPLCGYPLTEREQTNWSEELLEAVFALRQQIRSFNELVYRVNSAYPMTRGPLVVLLHVGVIGSEGTSGLYDAFRKLERLVG